MSAAAEIQVGTVNLYGIAPIVMTPSGGSAITGNISNVTFTDGFKEDTLPSQSGIVVETKIASQRMRTLEFDFAPTASSAANLLTNIDAILALTPLKLITITADVGTGVEGTYNYVGGYQYSRTRDGVAAFKLKMETYVTAADGAIFAGLAATT